MVQRLVIVDASELRLSGLQFMVSSDRNVRVGAAFLDVQQCEAYLNEHETQIVFLDDELPRAVDVWGLIDDWLRIAPRLKLVILSNNLTTRYVQKLFRYGITGYIHRDDCTRNTVLACLDALHHQQLYVSPTASAMLYRRQARAVATGLTRSDLDVLHCIEKGMTNQDIALHLGMDVRSIYRSRRNLKRMLGVKTNEQILDEARKQGLL